MNNTTNATSGRTGKVVRLLREYDIAGVGDELVERWTADDNRMSLRDLADYFNRQLLESQLDQQHVDVLPGETENMYQLLTDEDVTSGTRIQVENRLSEYGIDTEALRSDFVSRQAIHTYLTNHREESYDEPDTDEIVERRLAELKRLKSRQQAVTQQTVSTLRSRDRLDLGEFQVFSSVQIQCTDCGRQFDLPTLLDRGRCRCDTS